MNWSRGLGPHLSLIFSLLLVASAVAFGRGSAQSSGIAKPAAVPMVASGPVLAAAWPILDDLDGPTEDPTPTVPPTVPPPTPPPSSVDDETIDRLTVSGLLPGEAGQMRPGQSFTLVLGVVECCYFFEPVPVRATWSVSPTEGADVDPVTGVLTIDPTTPSGTVFTVTADVEDGRRLVTVEVYVYTPEANPLVGFWQEAAQLACDTGAEFVPEVPIGELVFEADGTFSVTWVPFEIYKDYWGTYVFDLAQATLELTVDGGNHVPSDLDLSGSFRFDDQGRLLLTDIWLGEPGSAAAAGERACGHRFVG
jgi:hypothetical protein